MRRRMLENDLPEELQEDILWERKRSRATANAVGKRKHVDDTVELQNCPNPYLEDISSQDYHWRGW